MTLYEPTLGKPRTHCADYASLPPPLLALTQHARWVVWRWERKSDGKWTKPPRQPRAPREKARANDARTWGTYEEALNAIEATGADGLGFQLLRNEEHVAAIDLDDCRDEATGAIDAWAGEIIDSVPGAYVEITPSGTGFRIIGIGAGPETQRKFAIRNARPKAAVEVYRDTGRYITITGAQRGACDALTNIDALIDGIVARHGGNGKAEPETLTHPAAEGRLPTWLSTLIATGTREGERSEQFYRVVSELKGLGWSVDSIVPLLEKYPGGIAEKYAGRVRAEVLRAYGKVDGPLAGVSLTSVVASQVKMRGISWFWPKRFALGKFGIIGGLPDQGKGQITYFMIARATNGGKWPCEEGTAPQGNVIILTAEDALEDTVIPRLKSAGADLTRVHIVQMMRDQDGKERMFNLATDLPALKAKIEEVGNVVLVVIDPISAYVGVGKINNSSTTDVRGILGPMAKLAEEKRMLIVGIMHFNKKADVTNAMLRIADSLAYVAASRHTYFVTVDPENENARLFVKAKNNLAPDSQALRYMFSAAMVGHDDELGVDIWAPFILWDKEHVKITATEAMEAEAGGKLSRSAAKDAEEFLRSALALGPVASEEIEESAKANGISRGSLFAAKKRLGIKAKKQKGVLDGSWCWEMPAATNEDF
jgi:hypothetical protein